MFLQHDRSAWIQGADVLCQMPPRHAPQCRRIVLLGAPGVGKGTQAALLSATFGGCHLTTGELFRAAQSADAATLSPALQAAVRAMRAGELVSDDTVLKMIVERVRCLRCPGGFLLDGFPRTLAQAAVLDVLLGQHELALDCALSLELDDEQLIRRAAGRRICPICHAIYHTISRPPHVENLCDHCGCDLVQRTDDAPEAVEVRLRHYHAHTACLREYYADQGLLVRVDADGNPEEVFTRTLAALGDRDSAADI